MKIELEMNTNKVSSRLKNQVKQVQPLLDQLVMKDSNYYVPEDTGLLKASVITGSNIGSGVLIWNTPYARNQYYSLPTKSTDRNPNARMKWFEVAKRNRRKHWLAFANKEYNK